MNKWLIEKRTTINQQKIFSIENLHCYHPVKKAHHDFLILNNPDWVNVVAVDTNGDLVLVKQHRLGTDEYTIETAAGLVNPGEDALHAAQRELLEETGYKAREIVLLKKLTSNPAIMNNSIYFYCALQSEKVAGQTLDDAEDIEIITVSAPQALEYIRNGTINHSIIVTALLLYFMSPYSSLHTVHNENISIY